MFLFTTMPELLSGSTIGSLLSSALEPNFRSFVQLCLAQINMFGFTVRLHDVCLVCVTRLYETPLAPPHQPVFNNPEAIGEDLDDQESSGTFGSKFHSSVCDDLSAGKKADTALAWITTFVFYVALVPVLHLLLHTVRALAAITQYACCDNDFPAPNLPAVCMVQRCVASKKAGKPFVEEKRFFRHHRWRGHSVDRGWLVAAQKRECEPRNR